VREPPVASWVPLTKSELGVLVRVLLAKTTRALVLVDGRSGAGKSTFAHRLAQVLDAAVVHTDDIAWQHSRFGWSDVLLDGVVTPWRRGAVVSLRPPGWGPSDRPGTVTVPPSPVLVVEGVGAGRAALASHADLVVWVRSDGDEARRRGVARDVTETHPDPSAPDPAPSVAADV
jgi:energy-coupling factor transporter ATP-binding protein EcfA2